ncbi:HTH domain-containing protein [Enteroscipio rubneri]|uniref:HTH domain-containing protein n=1 Tax=Enteroscipio rubneri TaxID=2070686 RepID=UPI0032097532
MDSEKRMLTAKEVAERLGVSRTTAYCVIRDLNADMQRKGCKTLAGRVSNVYFEEAFFGGVDRSEEKDVR